MSSTTDQTMSRRIYTLLLVHLFVVLARCQEAKKNGICESLGPRCGENNTSVEFCPGIGKEPLLLTSCGENQVCKSLGKVVKCLDNKISHICTEEGEFPDPLDCTQTIVCDEDDDEPAEKCRCPEGSVVFPGHGLQCVKGQCPRKNVTCGDGQYGYMELLDGTKTNYFYFCRNSEAVEIYNSNDWKNVKETSQLLVNGKKCVPYYEDWTDEYIEDNICERRGQRFPAECDCDYYQCDKHLRKDRYTCQKKKYFNADIGKCVKGRCDESKCIYRHEDNSSESSSYEE
ncbi:UNVERIFIED_CONTAM: hypothetical protein PYX00_002746 [Menopon gallinae]|uniref:Uncharacterized protein n=1 Tax=Menopon gallinae TaxID=328185 RepID=A0AAW2HXR5_9NEOP